MGVAQLLKAMRARPGGDKRPKGPTGPHPAPHTGHADCLPGVAELRAAIAHPAVEADSERQRHVEVSSSTMTSAVAPLAADATTPPSFFRYPDTRQGTYNCHIQWQRRMQWHRSPHWQSHSKPLTHKRCPSSTKLRHTTHFHCKFHGVLPTYALKLDSTRRP